MNDNSGNIFLILFHISVVVKGVENKLESLGYNVEVISDNYEKINNRVNKEGVFIFYLPPDITDDQLKKDQLFKMIGLISSVRRRAVIIAEKEDRDILENEIPQISDHIWFERPVDMDAFVETVRKEMISPGEKDQKKRILIVDDDPSYAGMVREWIKGCYHVDIVTAGMQAITFLLRKPVDIILLDYEMPVVDGPQVLQMLRQEEATSNIPIVFLTGNGTKEAVARVMALKPRGYILKSTTKENLLNYLRDKFN